MIPSGVLQLWLIGQEDAPVAADLPLACGSRVRTKTLGVRERIRNRCQKLVFGNGNIRIEEDIQHQGGALTKSFRRSFQTNNRAGTSRVFGLTLTTK